MKVRICVTAQDIKNGEPREGSCCPVALAVARELRLLAPAKAEGVYVGDDSIVLGSLGEVVAPWSVQNFIQFFDNREEPISCVVDVVKPFDFVIEVPL